MEFLDQSEIDALLASGSEQNDDSGATAAGDANASAAASGVSLPDQFRLSASEEQISRILPIKIPVRVRLAERRMNIAQLLELNIGTIIEFDRSSEAELDLVANNVPIGVGNAVKCGENFGLRVVKIEPHIQRLLAAGLIR